MGKSAAKTRTSALEVPQTDEAANALLAEYGEGYNAVARIDAGMNDALARVKASFEEQSKPLQERLKAIEAQLSGWAAAHRDRLTENGRTKTVKLAAGEIGWRALPPSVRWIKGMKAEDVVSAIIAAGMKRFLRVKYEPNKERMLEEPDVAKLIKGVVIGSAGETFFVAPFGAELSEPK
jgi:phage host-nuclease inhibitor protein Gam